MDAYTRYARAHSIDKNLDVLRERLNALQSASVSSVPKAAGPVGSGSNRRPSQGHSRRECWQFSAFPANGKNPRSHRLRKHLKNGISRMTSFREVLFWSVFHMARVESVKKFFSEASRGTEPYEKMSSGKTAVTMPASCFTTEQHVKSLLRPTLALDCNFLAKTLWLCVFLPNFLVAKPEPLKSARWRCALLPVGSG